MANVYVDIKASLLKMCNDMFASSPEQVQIFDFDAHATIEEFPEADLVGIAEYQIENLDRHYIITAMITVCTTAEDDQIVKLTQYINTIFDTLIPGYRTIPVVDSNTGVSRGNLVVMDNVKALPVGRTSTRPLQMVAVSFASAFHQTS